MESVLANHFVMIGAILVGISILVSSLSSKLGLPILLIFISVGMIAGNCGVIVFDNYKLAYFVGNIALALILLDGGLRTRTSSFRVALFPAIFLSTIGVLCTTVLTSVAASWLFNFHWMEGLLLGAIVGSTDAAAVFSLLGGKGLNERVAATLEIESGSNDPMAVFMTVTLIEMLSKSNNIHFFKIEIVISLLNQVICGGLIGLIGGLLLRKLINRIHLTTALYPLLVISGGLLIFALANTFGGSGILAIYICGLLIGNRPIRNKHGILHILDGIAWLSQIGMFLMLGLLVKPLELVAISLPALMLSLWMILIARPISVLIALIPFVSFKKREKFFIAWVGLKGAVPIILAVFPFISGIEHSILFFHVSFFIVLCSLVIQGSSIPFTAKFLKVVVPSNKVPPIYRSGLEINPNSEWELFIYQLNKDKWCIGAALRELKMPEGTIIAALFRGISLIHPSGSTILESDDIICVIGHECDIPYLGKLFSESPEPFNKRFFGDFLLEGSAILSAVASIYGLKLNDINGEQSLGRFISTKICGEAIIGDQVEWNGLTWIVAELDGTKICKVGVKFPKYKNILA